MKVMLRTPSLPNYLFIEVNGQEVGNISVGDVSDDDLKEVAERWVKALMEHARKKRLDKAGL